MSAALDGLVSAISLHFRRRRMARFARAFGICARTRILDIGGTPDCWRLLPETPRVVLLNMPRAKDDLASADAWVGGDGRRLPFRDNSFDIVFSNSAIEHVGGAAGQELFAREAARVGRGYWIQTPNRWFPVEQHLLTPFLHWLPERWRSAAARRSVWSFLSRATPDRKRFYAEHWARDVRLLGAGDMRRLFPDGEIIRERFCGVTKSLIAWRKSV